MRVGEEGVDLSYTKSGDIDNNAYNFVKPEMGQLYVGWTVPGEWINYTVTVARTATYHIGLMYTANTDGAISLSVDGNDIAGKISIPTTHPIASIKLAKGIHVLTLFSLSGNMNYDYLEFREVK